jgi:uncharacterized protein (TIGR02001 family)
MKKQLFAFGAAALMAVPAVSAQDELSVTGSMAIESSYMFRGVKFAEVTYFPSVDVAYGNAYAGLWSALPLDTDEGNEVDIYAGYGFALSDLVSLDVGLTYYTFPSIDDETLEFYAGVAFDVEFSPAIYVYYDKDREVLTFEASAGYSFEVAENVSFDLSGAIGYATGDDGTLMGVGVDDYTYAVASAGFSYTINEAASVSVYGSYSVASEDYAFSDGGTPDIEDDELWFGISVSTGF